MPKRPALRSATLVAWVAVVACGKAASVPAPPPPGTAPAPVRVEAAAPAETTDARIDRGPDAAAETGADTEVSPEAPVAEVMATAPADAAPADVADAGMWLESTGFLSVGGERVFPRSASYPVDESPPFTFHGVPAAAKSLAFTFVDRSNGATKWVVWNIPPATAGLPAKMSRTVHPAELPTATQRGSLGRTGYSGPGVRGPPLHTYDFVLWALDVEALPGTDGVSTARLRTEILPRHAIAKSATFTAKGQLGGP